MLLCPYRPHAHAGVHIPHLLSPLVILRDDMTALPSRIVVPGNSSVAFSTEARSGRRETAINP